MIADHLLNIISSDVMMIQVMMIEDHRFKIRFTLILD